MGVIFKNNVMYGAGDIEISPICYSEEEREVGCWTDGKPLYQKTIYTTITTSNNQGNNQYTGDVNLSSFISNPEFIFFDAVNSYYHPASTETRGFLYGYGDPQNNYVTVATLYARSNVSACITIQYTKTTDTPGSGTWTPSGLPTVHYSTDEQVVGTWVDGSAIYEKTYELDTAFVISAQAWGTTTIDVSFVSKFIEPAYVGTSGASSYICFVDISNNKLQLYNMRNDAAIGVKYITIRYLKAQAS